MYTTWRPLQTSISLSRRSIVYRFRNLSVNKPSVSRPHSSVRAASTAKPTKTKQPPPQLLVGFREQAQTHDGTLISRGDFIELKDGDFLKVTGIFQHMMRSAYEISVIEGFRFRKTEKTIGFSREGPNDLYLNLYMSESYGLQNVEVSEVLRKKNMVLMHPSSCDKRTSETEPSSAPNGCEVFYCSQMRVYYVNDAYGKSRKRKEIGHNPNELFSFSGTHIECFYSLHFDPKTDGLGVETALTDGSEYHRQIGPKLKLCYDEHTNRASSEDVSLTSALGALSMDNKKTPTKMLGTSTIQASSPRDDGETVYTFGDLYCGCGGASCGAAMAGLLVKWGLDSNLAACDSWRLNFPDAHCLEMDARHFSGISERLVDERLVEVDILHISNPCQYFAKPKTTEAKNDEANVEAAMVIGDWLDIAKPRIATLENVDGLTIRKNGMGSGPTVRDCFGKIQQQFESRGYAFSCKIVNMADYGLPQNRKRLIIIAAREGTRLPDMPAPTHSKDPEETGLLPHVTMREALTDVPRWPDQREPRSLSCVTGDGDQPAHTVMASEPIRHFSDNRNLTLEELARLQGFPDEHRFRKREVRKQICNAQPPSFGKILYTTIVKYLREQDRHRT